LPAALKPSLEAIWTFSQHAVQGFLLPLIQLTAQAIYQLCLIDQELDERSGALAQGRSNSGGGCAAIPTNSSLFHGPTVARSKSSVRAEKSVLALQLYTFPDSFLPR
jgi:hypothetical protein